MGGPRWPVVWPRCLRPAHAFRGRPGPPFTGRDPAAHRGAGLDLGALADPGAGQEGAAGPHGGVGADHDPSDAQFVAVEPVAGQVHLGLHRCPVAQLEQPGDRGERVQVDALAHLGPQRPGVVHDPRRPGQVGGPGGVTQLFGRPQAHVHPAPARVGAGLHAPQEQPGAHGGDRHAPRRRDQQHPAAQQPGP